MDTTMANHVAHTMTPSTGMPEWYFAILIVGIVGLVLGWRYISLKFGTQSQQSQTNTTAQPQQSSQADVAALERIITNEMGSLRELVDVKFEALEDRVKSELDGFRTALKESEAREGVRMDAFSKQMAEGFRAVHERIDRHIDSETKAQTPHG